MIDIDTTPHHLESDCTEAYAEQHLLNCERTAKEDGPRISTGMLVDVFADDGYCGRGRVVSKPKWDPSSLSYAHTIELNGEIHRGVSEGYLCRFAAGGWEQKALMLARTVNGGCHE